MRLEVQKIVGIMLVLSLCGSCFSPVYGNTTGESRQICLNDDWPEQKRSAVSDMGSEECVLELTNQ